MRHASMQEVKGFSNSQTLNATADHLEVNGWVQGWIDDSKPEATAVCLESAMMLVLGIIDLETLRDNEGPDGSEYDLRVCPVYSALKDYIGTGWWDQKYAEYVANVEQNNSTTKTYLESRGELARYYPHTAQSRACWEDDYGWLYYWNDDSVNKDITDIVQVLRSAALIEEARELGYEFSMINTKESVSA